MAAANEVGSRYVEDPPLIQAASVRVKIARVAAALAARLFSTDETNERVIVKPEHVEAAVQFMDRLYKMIASGYADRSRERIADIAQARENEGNIKQYLWGNKSLAKFLRSSSRFRRQDLEEILNIQRDEANGIINKLWESRMVRKDGQDVRVEPVLHSLLREATWQ